MKRYLTFLAVTILSQWLFAGSDTSHRFSDLREWNGGSTEIREGELIACFTSGSPLSFAYPEGEKGWYRFGLDWVHDGSADWRDLHGIRFEVFLPNLTEVSGTATMHTAPMLQGSKYVVETYQSRIRIAGEGWHTVTIPIQSFDFKKSNPTPLETIKKLELTLYSSEGEEIELLFKAPHLIKAERVHLHSEIRSKPGDRGEFVTYTLNLENCTAQPQAVTLSRLIKGREVMETIISPSSLVLEPWASDTAEVKVKVSERVAPGGQETQLIQALANGSDAGQMEYITLSKMKHPYVMHTQERWEELFQKVENIAWAKDAAQEYIDDAEKWVVPAIDLNMISDRTHVPYLYHNNTAHDFLGAAVAYKLTGDLKYAKKAARYILQLADPEIGYPRTNQVNQNNLVKEGAYFQYLAMGYDILFDSGVFTEEDHQSIEHTFRLFHKVIDSHIASNSMGNWQVAELIGCIYTGLVIQDWAVVKRFIEGPGGFYEQLSNGVMSDGWWFECSIGYNAWVSREFTQLALALQPWGIDYQYASFPASYSQEYNIFQNDAEQRKLSYYGMPFQKWGPVQKPYIRITDMWDALIPYIDYRGVMFAVNDSQENKFESIDYEVAYFAYRDPKYAAIIKNNSKRDLLYGLELPEETPELGSGSAYSDNVGVAMLRSKAEGEHPRERIQAVLKYGTHGGYHGHFDRASLNSLIRYGRSFYNPEHIWFGYPNFMYKFFVQTSLPHNMVVVDMKQQEPVESSRLFFKEGNMIQGSAVETNARWSNPPYGGIYYSNFQKPLQEKSWAEGRYLPQPEEEPKYGSIGEYSEPITQRRLLAVTDDYVVVADYLKATEEHTFDCLFNIKGFQGIESDKLGEQTHSESMNPNPVLAAQFITDCNWYESEGTTKVRFETQFGPGADNAGTRMHGEDGILKMDVYSAWPLDREVMIGSLPESHGVNRKFWYEVLGDGETLAEGKFGAWILGRSEIDVSLEGVDTLTLKTRAEFKKNAKKTLFWGEPVVVTASGQELKLSDLKLEYEQIDQTEKNVDYYGGPVKISGRQFHHSVAANPVKSGIEGRVTVDLRGLNAIRLKTFVGGDFPLGDETWRRKSLSFRSKGTEAKFLTVVEPFEKDSVVKSVNALSEKQLEIELKDGRKHIVTVENLDKGKDIRIGLAEYVDGKLIKEERLTE